MSNVLRRLVRAAPARAWVLALTSTAAGLVAATAVGCGSADHPSSTADTSSELVGGVADEADAAATASMPVAGSGEPGTSKHVCAPRSSRECHWYYTDESGQPQCPTSFELCDVDGSGWLACGEYQIGASGDPERIH